MSMGYSAGKAETVEQDFVIETCPKEFKNLIKILNAENVDFDTFANDIEFYPEQFDKKITDAFDALVSEFKEQTGLDLGISYHDKENNGDRDDEIDGAYWYLGFDSVYQMTEAAKKIINKIHTKTFVHFG